MARTYRVERLGGPIGAVIQGIDLADPQTSDIEFIQQALKDHLVVFFRDQLLNPTNLLELASIFGTPTPYPYVPGLPDFPEIVEVIKRPQDSINFGGVWHSDTAYLETPAMGALLYGVDIPATGGDTLFTNMYDVYEALTPGMQTFLKALYAINDADNEAIAATRPGNQRKALRAIHPVVRTHPVTGKPLLYINKAHTTRFEGMTTAESEPILTYLFDHISKPEFSCRFRWQTGSLAFWDNRACQHYPLNDYQGQLRRMLRVSLAGDKPY